jgi:CHAT domain-containing protein
MELKEKEAIERMARWVVELDLSQRSAQALDLYRRVLDWKGARGIRQMEALLARDRPELRPVLEELASIRTRLAELAFTEPDPARRDVWRKQLDVLLKRKGDLEVDLGQRSAVYRAGVRAARIGPAEVAAALPAGTALVDLVVYSHDRWLPAGKGQSERTLRRLLAFVVRPRRPVVCVVLGEEVAVVAAVVDWHWALLTRQPEALDRAAGTLGSLVWEPLRRDLGDARTVLVAQDWPLSIFPLAALPGSRPGSYLIEHMAIGYVGSATEAAAQLSSPANTASGGLLAAGAIDFRADPGRAASTSAARGSFVASAEERGAFRPLPGTRLECELARDLFRRAFPKEQAVLLTGGEATEGEIKSRLDGGRWRAVHLATHGFFESPDRVAALRARTGREHSLPLASPHGPADETDAFGLTPLLHSGVVLAGGGRAPVPGRPEASSEDGILTAEEVLSLDLRRTDLVVLSGCETGLGQGRYGQGLLGLQRAFHAAGTRSVVASLWKVDDAATSVLMEHFYTNLWVREMPRLEALRSAQLTVLRHPELVQTRRDDLARRGIDEAPKKLLPGGPAARPTPRGARSDPSIWAAFVLSGDGR